MLQAHPWETRLKTKNLDDSKRLSLSSQANLNTVRPQPKVLAITSMLQTCEGQSVLQSSMLAYTLTRGAAYCWLMGKGGMDSYSSLYIGPR